MKMSAQHIPAWPEDGITQNLTVLQDHKLWVDRSVVLCILAAVYILAGKIGLQLAIFHPSATPVWPPTGISLAAFLLLGYWVWPAIFVGAFAVNVTTAGSIGSSLGIATGNTLEGLVGALLVNRFANGRNSFARQGDTLKFVLLAALFSTTVSATIGVTSLSLGGYADWQRYAVIWITWWLGDVVGALIVTPAIVLWASEHTLNWSRSQLVEIGVSLPLLCLVTWIVFQSSQAMTGPNYPLAFLTLSILIWVAVRLGPRETVTAILLCAGIAIWGTLQGSGPFARGNPHESLLLLQAFIAVIAVTALLLAVGVAERRRAEQELDELNRSLERRIQDRTSTLQATVEQLQEFNQLKNAFVGIVSHELRTPLTSIKSLTENLQGELAGPLNEKQKHYASRIQFNADRLTRMLNELLNLSKIESGKLELCPTILSLQELLADLVEVFQPVAQRKSIMMDIGSMERLPKVRVDRDKLYEVLANLLENAIKFTPSGGRVHIGAQILDDRHIKMSISDTGCGIPEEHLPKIFDKFYRVQAGTGQVAGSGLGLAIAKGLIELHGGTIGVESAPGKGSQFYFTLPFTT
ncbi:MAG TPA: MASE1 domain-containing protein [Terriglobia bacterium]|nr:MASE1 domain-containing protein [Terriglobia bacterium]